MQVAEPTATPAAAPFGREHDEVERVGDLDLEPRGAAAAGLVGRRERFRHQSLVSPVERVAQEPLGRLTLRGHDARHDQVRRHVSGERRDALLGRAIDQIRAVRMQTVEAEQRQRN